MRFNQIRESLQPPMYQNYKLYSQKVVEGGRWLKLQKGTITKLCLSVPTRFMNGLNNTCTSSTLEPVCVYWGSRGICLVLVKCCMYRLSGRERQSIFLGCRMVWSDGFILVSPQVIRELKELYDNKTHPDKLDVFVGGLLETTHDGPGPLFQTILLDQFMRIRHGDRFWFENKDNGYSFLFDCNNRYLCKCSCY